MLFRDLKQQYQMLKPQIEKAVSGVLSDCDFIAGAPVRELETRLAEYVGVRHCITCANGTEAIELALLAFGIGRGDAVFVPDFTFFATAEMPAARGAMPVFVDVDASTFNLDPEKLEQAVLHVISEGRLCPRAIIAVDLFGQCADYRAIMAIAAKYDLILIEDAAQGFGGRLGEQRACSFGDIAATSFFPSKPLGCYGDGGAVFTDDDRTAELIRSFAVHGRGMHKYENVRVGINSRLDTLQAAVLLVKLNAFTNFELEAVNTVANWYTDRLGDLVSTPVVKMGFYSSWAQYTIQLKNLEKRRSVQERLNASGIPTMVYYPKSLHRQPAFADLPIYEKCPVAEHLCETVLSLPIHPYMTKREVQEVVSCLKEGLQ